MKLATHFYSYRITTDRPYGRIGRHLTGRIQTDGAVTQEQAKALIAETHHNALGTFVLTELLLIEGEALS